MRTIVLDNEAVQALASQSHPKHRRVAAHLEGATTRRRRGRPVELVVPTAVRVEAGWDRSQPGSALLNRFRVRDHALDGSTADVAASIVAATVTNVADAHIGAAVRSLTSTDVVVLSSDPVDMARVCTPRPVRVVAI
ncbi:MAG TPA: hypothetical protein VM143_00620 [Acidimicrobiales bacterium]|nr:hypothetical protein [Acidimicrobiales bacterium]